MKFRTLAAPIPSLLTVLIARPVSALDGEPFIDDPATVTLCDGKFYTYGRGGGGLMSDDGWTWHRGAVRMRARSG